MEPEELRAEQRWSSIPQHSMPNGYWPKHLDEKLLVLVTNATASGDRFPVGVNWLDISRSIGYSPVECVKRYAFLHHARERLSSAEDHAERREVAHNPTTQHEKIDDAEDVNNPFAGMSSSDDLGSPHSRAFLEYGSPLASPRLQSLENSGEFGVGSPGSPPPFALRAAYKGDIGVSSPLRWENVAKETYAAPILKSPPHIRTSFGVNEADEARTRRGAFEDSQSPRIVLGTQSHSKFTDPNFAADIVNHAFKGLRFDDDLPPAVTSPRMIRTISNSEFPFLKDDDRKGTRTSTPLSVRNDSQTLVGGRVQHQSRPLSAVQNTPPLASSPGSQLLASFQGENPFSGSLTQSALEDAFLDMAGSRLDASSMLFPSRFAASQTRLQTEQSPSQSQSGQQNWSRAQRKS